MKYLYLLVLLLLLTVETFTQTLPDSSGLSVLQKKWERTRHKNPSGSNNSTLNQDPFRANDEARQANEDQKEYLRQRDLRAKQGATPEGPRERVKKPEFPYNGASTVYTYQIKVRNNGTKTIQKVVWEYILFSPTTNQELRRHEFVSMTNLKPGKTDNLVMQEFSLPTGTINANDVGKKVPDQYIEQVNIKSIQYTDGSVWQANSK